MIYTIPIISIIICIISILYYNIQLYYRYTSRILRRLESMYRSPVYTLYSECISDAVSIRSLGNITSVYIQNKLIKALNEYIQIHLYNNIASQWLNIRLQVLGCYITFTLCLFAVLSSCIHISYIPLPAVNPSLLGLALTYSLSIVGNLSGLVSSLVETEQEMVSVERVRQYLLLPPEEPAALVDERGSDGEGVDKTAGTVPPIITRTSVVNGQHKRSYLSSFASRYLPSYLSGAGGGGDSIGSGLDMPLLDPEYAEDDSDAGDDEEEEEGYVLTQDLVSLSSWKYLSLASLFKKPSSTSLSPLPYNSPDSIAMATLVPQSISRSGSKVSRSDLKHWPSAGHILFSNVSMKYAADLPYALKDLSFVISSGSRVAVVGRTGKTHYLPSTLMCQVPIEY